MEATSWWMHPKLAPEAELRHFLLFCICFGQDEKCLVSENKILKLPAQPFILKYLSITM